MRTLPVAYGNDAIGNVRDVGDMGFDADGAEHTCTHGDLTRRSVLWLSNYVMRAFLILFICAGLRIRECAAGDTL